MTPEQELKEAIMGAVPTSERVATSGPQRGSTAFRVARHVGVVFVTRVALVGALVTGSWTFLHSDWAQANVVALQPSARSAALIGVSRDPLTGLVSVVSN